MERILAYMELLASSMSALLSLILDHLLKSEIVKYFSNIASVLGTLERTMQKQPCLQKQREKGSTYIL